MIKTHWETDHIPEPTKPSLIELADAAFRQAAAEVVRRAKQAGTPNIVWENGQIRAIPPDEIPEEEAGDLAAPPRQTPT
jgi:hypothetical protein